MRTTTAPRTRADRARRRRPPTRGPTTITTAQRTHTTPTSAHVGSPVTSRRSPSGRALHGAADPVLCGDRGARRRLVVRAGAVLPDCRAADLAVAAAQGSAAVRQGPARKARDPARRVHPPGQPVSRVRLVPRERPWHGGALAVRARAGVAFRPGPDLVPRGAARVLLGLRAVAGLALGCAAARVAAPAGN